MEREPNSMRVRIYALIIGLVIDAYGNSLTIVADNGNGLWTAVAVQFNQLFNVSVSWALLAFGLINIVLNQFLIRRFDWWRIVSGIFYMCFFSYLIALFNQLNHWLRIDELSFPLSLILTVLGTIMIGVAISLYQRANILMHPNDDTTNILRFRFFHGSVMKAQFANLNTIAFLIIICAILIHSFDAVGIGTVLSLFALAPVIKLADQIVMPGLKHNFNRRDAV